MLNRKKQKIQAIIYAICIALITINIVALLVYIQIKGNELEKEQLNDSTNPIEIIN